MSRIGRQPIEIPSGVTVEVSPGGNVTVTGPLGTLEQRVPARMQIAQEDGVVTVDAPTERGEDPRAARASRGRSSRTWSRASRRASRSISRSRGSGIARSSRAPSSSSPSASRTR
jgi:hypothetical protein